MPNTGNLHLTFALHTLVLKHPFGLSHSTRTTTPGVPVRIDWRGLAGYGEAAMPHYMGETAEGAMAFLSRLDLRGFGDPLLIDDIMALVDNAAPGNFAAKASVDIALHDLAGKVMGVPCCKMFGLDKTKTPLSTYTIGIGSDEETRSKIAEAEAMGFKMLKVKVGTPRDKQIIECVRRHTSLPIAVDANQGWSDVEEAIDMAHWLHERNVVMIEQPMSKDETSKSARLAEASPIPVFADESVQSVDDIPKLKGAFDGINIKLMKCGGMRQAWRMIGLAKSLGMKTMLGCMTETSCAVSAAAQLSPAVDYADLDGNLLISNDIFKGMTIVGGKITLGDKPGIGVMPVAPPSMA